MSSEEKKLLRAPGLILYLAGAVLAFTLLTLSVWGEVEASTFGAAQRSDERLRTLNCPVLITRDEIGVISAVFENPSEKDANPLVRSTITMGFVTLVDQQNQRVSIPAGGSQELTWEVTRENAAYNSLILARFYQLRNFGVPSRQEACGIVVLPISGLTGQQVFIGAFTASIVLMAVGLMLYTPKGVLTYDLQNARHQRLRAVIRSFIFLGAYFLVAVLVSLLGNWLLSIILMVFAIVSTIGVFAFALSSD